MQLPRILTRSDTWVIAGPDKQPINALTGQLAQNNNPRTWATYPQALLGMERYNLPYLGYVFTGNGITGVDIDRCRNAETGRLTELASDIIGYLDSYTEISLSGTGTHILCYGKLPPGRRQCDMDQDGIKAHFGMYDSKRFFVMTGDVLDDGHTEIMGRQEQITALHNYFLLDARVTQSQYIPSLPLDLDDMDLIRKAAMAKNGELFKTLFSGNWENLKNSHSEADFALINFLIFWAGRDLERINRLFRQSGLYRQKWDRRGAADIQQAVATFNGRTYPELMAAKAVQYVK